MTKRSIATVAVVVAGALLVACGSATEPEVIEGGPPVSLETMYVTSGVNADSIPEYFLHIRSTFVNVQNTTVYVHQWCDEGLAGDTAYAPWIALARDSTDNTAIDYEFFGCYLNSGGAATAPPRALAPGDSLTADLRFPSSLGHVPTAADSAALTGRMHLEYIVTWSGAQFTSSAQLIPLSLRKSASFSVALP